MHFYYEEPPTTLEHIRALAEHLNLLAHKVRQAVTHSVSETIARLAHDATERFMNRIAEPESDEDEWDDETEVWQRPAAGTIAGALTGPSMTNEQRLMIDRAIAAGLATAGWLLRRGRPWTALGLGSAVALAVASGSKLSRRGWNLTGTIAELITLAAPLSRGRS